MEQLDEQKNLKKPVWKKWWFWLIAVILLGIALSGGDDKSKETTSPKTVSPSFSMEFNPTISQVIKDNTITVNAKYDCPDGAIMQLLLMSGDLKDMQSEKAVVKNGKTSTKFTLKSTDPQAYAGSITFQFNADSIKQPKNVKDVYGSHGEKLEGDNAQDATFKDGAPGKNATKQFSVSYPSEEAVDARNTELFNEAAQKMVSASNGVILDVERPSPGIYHVVVSNASWYLSSEGEKQYFAEELLKTFNQVGKNFDNSDYVSLTLFDESMNEVADSKMMGGMKIKR